MPAFAGMMEWLAVISRIAPPVALFSVQGCYFETTFVLNNGFRRFMSGESHHSSLDPMDCRQS